MVDRDKVQGLVEHLRRYTGYLTQGARTSLADHLADPVAIGSMRYYLQVSIETCINIANHVIASEGLRSPRDYRDSFAVLNEAGVLPDDLTQTMRELAGLRNLLVHLYWDVDDAMVYWGIRDGLGDFDRYVRCIVERYLAGS